MELRQLRYFIKAKELLNFTEAAAQLFISQSTLSQQIKQLEDELGTPLFNRVGKHVYLTEAGHLFYTYALQCVQKANDGYQLLKDLGSLETGHLTIGTTYGLRHILSPAIMAFHQKHPQITIDVVFGTSKELTDRLSKFEIDFVLTFEEVTHNQSMKYQPLFSSELCLIACKGSPLTSKKTVTLQDIEHLPLALPARGFSTRKFVNEVFEKHQLTPKVNLETNDIPTLLELVGTGYWNTILAQTTVSNQKNLVSIPIRSLKTLQQAAIVSLNDVYEKQAVKAFFDVLLHLDLNELH